MEESLSTTTLQTDTDISVDDIEQSKALNELSLREAQVGDFVVLNFWFTF